MAESWAAPPRSQPSPLPSLPPPQDSNPWASAEEETSSADVKFAIKTDPVDVKPFFKLEGDVKPGLEPILGSEVKQEGLWEAEGDQGVDPPGGEEGGFFDTRNSAAPNARSEQDIILAIVSSAPPTLLRTLFSQAATLSSEFQSLLRSFVAQLPPSPSPLAVTGPSVISGRRESRFGGGE
ncbi:hypothetical protein BDY24DRAFT_386832 [Mrakia frigida]|uniref:uncharacterized protein n=1 Tax=Mrakia frigida TaxID=29902 RepID=UPI003FCC01D8